MQSQSAWGGYGGYGGEDPAPREPGARRKKLAAMAGSVYRAGVAAAGEMREQYNNTRFRNVDNSIDPQMTIPGSFPNVKIVHRGDEQMVLFPSYAKRHVRQFDDDGNRLDHKHQMSMQHQDGQAAMNDEEYWHNEWARVEDAKAVVDVDVRGWIYSPHKGPMTRKNRILIGLARRMSGIPPPTITQDSGGHEDLREQQKIAKEAEEIERRGKGEEEVANRGGYSEAPYSRGGAYDHEASTLTVGRAQTINRSGGGTPESPPSSPAIYPRTTTSAPTSASELTEAEMAVANSNLMARLGPFLTTPLVQQAVTIFFYNEQTSQSRTVTTNDAGHFSIRAALDFVPTDIRVLANENLSATEPVEIIEPRGISLISDIDDTIKRSNISLGAREIFRNTFIRDLAEMSVDGTKKWYNTLHDMGVQLHYCSNSPWQLFPVLATFFHGSGLPPGSLHLKHYAGMLQGIFEPVAERKKGTLERIMEDFPERKFLLVGDSGEADLEVYTDLAMANPGRILAVFIRDVTTPEEPPSLGFFDSTFDPTAGLRQKAIDRTAGERSSRRPAPPVRTHSMPPNTEAPVEDLIDLSDEPEQIKLNTTAQSLAGLSLDNGQSAARSKPVPPARPAKPAALRGSPSFTRDSAMHPLAQMQNSSFQSTNSETEVPAPPLPRRPIGSAIKTPSSSNSLTMNSRHGSEDSNSNPKPAPPPPRRRGTPTSQPGSQQRKPGTDSNPEMSSPGKWEILPPPAHPGISRTSTGGTMASTTTASNGANTTAANAINKRVELWHRRLDRAQEILSSQGVALYTWRRGDDVILEATGIVKRAMAELKR
ncbi:hypothetical protein MCOR27_011325 [Pyricularia oryzae]|uniref:Phosphatidate phosphatase APP1 catalytic domain-containing protein n=5 Tax=Pyricularia TaxID=48558 RepID=A0ABQ8NJN7_PYRGI|nr:uncharacterized protein MGG_07714 [Pyricularia oryzae 70-15]ELQ41692.1 hypothetical protein OOU_Y34scaffold00257g12 [Pyricularia oryzae Y34]KAH8848302.1 hypothetical protein MCOR01_001678 [Pyricularia oryzae]KAI6298164.1 hypothetical protein MCOR33_005622 [Pyricularia grisea]EHA53110.1 hypothetical protein MGG_07714 [Pyricularia oryzae 70-15]KAH9429754.1 hypothetical protein MCOR02_009492 [Pyricularia oryzae]